MTKPKEKPTVKLIDTDGNAFAIMGRVWSVGDRPIGLLVRHKKRERWLLSRADILSRWPWKRRQWQIGDGPNQTIVNKAKITKTKFIKTVLKPPFWGENCV